MIRYKEISFTAYPVTDLAKSRKFYEEVLSLKSNGEWDTDTWVEYDLGPGTLAVVKSNEQWKPSADGAAVALEVEDFDAAVEELRSKGVEFIIGPHDCPTCKMAVFQDPDGNKLAIHKRKKG